METHASRCLIRKALAWCSLTGVAVVVATIAGWSLLAAPTMGVTGISLKPAAGNITADDASMSGLSATAPLTQTPVVTMTSLSATPPNPVTNQSVTLVALVTVGQGGVPPSGTITFEDGGNAIPGCTGLTVTPASGQTGAASTCQTSFAAAGSPAQLTAAFTPNPGGNFADSVGLASLPVSAGATSTSLAVSKPTVNAGSPLTYTATVTPTDAGATTPSGDVEFIDAGKPIAGCTSQRLTSGTASARATCTITYQQAGHHTITARYGGDANFSGSSTSQAQHVTVQPLPILGTVKATMTWTFFYTPTWTALRAFTITGAPVGSTVALRCSGEGCPFARRVNNVRKTPCTSKASARCPASHPVTINLMRGFQGRRLKAGARIIVTVSRPQWIGKYYLFTIRPAQPPAIHIECLAPGSSTPGAGCKLSVAARA